MGGRGWNPYPLLKFDFLKMAVFKVTFKNKNIKNFTLTEVFEMSFSAHHYLSNFLGSYCVISDITQCDIIVHNAIHSTK